MVIPPSYLATKTQYLNVPNFTQNIKPKLLGFYFQNYDVAKGLVDNWVPRCYRQGTPCTSMLQFVRCLPFTYYDAEGQQHSSLSE